MEGTCCTRKADDGQVVSQVSSLQLTPPVWLAAESKLEIGSQLQVVIAVVGAAAVALLHESAVVQEAVAPAPEEE